MKNLQELLTVAQQMAGNRTAALRSTAKRYPEVTLGATIGQVLQFNSDHRLEMQTCWLTVKVTPDHHDQTYKVAFQLLLADLADRYIYPGTALLDTLTDPNHNIGSRTIIFHRKARENIDFRYEDDLQRQVKKFAIQTIPPVDLLVCEHRGALVIKREFSLLGLGQPASTYLDNRECLVRNYNQPSWGELSVVSPLSSSRENEDHNPSHDGAIETGWRTIIIPTIWLKDPEHYECFLDFHANWRTVTSGHRITGKVGPFVVAHWARNDTWLATSTSLRLCDSAWPQETYSS